MSTDGIGDPSSDGIQVRIENILPPPTENRRIVKAVHPVGGRDTVLVSRDNDAKPESGLLLSKNGKVDSSSPADENTQTPVECTSSWNPLFKAAWFSPYIQPNHKRTGRFGNEANEPEEKRLRSDGYDPPSSPGSSPPSDGGGSVRRAAWGAAVVALATLTVMLIANRRKK